MTTPDMQDEKRIEIIQRVFRGELTVLRAAVILGISAHGQGGGSFLCSGGGDTSLVALKVSEKQG